MSAQPQPENTNRAVVKRPNERMLEVLDKMKGQIAAALPRHIKPEYLVRVIVTTCNKNPELYQAFAENPASFLGAVMECSQLGLVPDGVLGMAYLIPRKNSRNSGRRDTVLQLGYKGLMDLAYRTGRVHFIKGETVFEKDHFEYDLAQMTIEHRPAEGERGQATHYYAVARVEGVPFPVFAVMSKADALRHRDRFAARKADNAPWWEHFDAMAEKSCVRELCKWLPRATEIDAGRLSRAAALDELAEAAVPQDLGAAVTIDGVVIEDDEGGASEPEQQREPEQAAPATRRGASALKDELRRKAGAPPAEKSAAEAPAPAAAASAAPEAPAKDDLFTDM